LNEEHILNHDTIFMTQLIRIYFLLFSWGIFANNIQVSNVVLTGQNTNDDFTMVQFDLTWENSWRISSGPSNWDAAWVFVKYRVGSGPWLHAFLNNTGHNTGTGTVATIAPGLLNTANAFNATNNPAMGAFVHRSVIGAGTFTQTGLQLRWNYGANNITDNAAVDVKVFAVEMVYVPSGNFQVGDFQQFNIRGHFRNGSTNTPLAISSENALTLGGTVNGNLANNNAQNMSIADDFNNTITQSLPAAFPKGFNAFYCMKYEISQQQWIDFFNVLDNTQKTNRDITGNLGKNSDAIVARNNISWGSGDATLNGGTHGNVACNYLSWMDGAAFADWASLRPMTELEFEKTCRGNSTPIDGEFAWGTTTIISANGITNSGNFNEVASNIGANTNHSGGGIGGPLRVGIFSSSNYTREEAGASFYGVMDLSGNLGERTVTVGNLIGRNFTAPIHGDGLLTNDGFCDIATWPGFESGKVVNATGSGSRGGSFSDSVIILSVSNRISAASANSARLSNIGFRAVRSVE
jgi:formylglycine-generating enzyme required for sulfatase activity